MDRRINYTPLSVDRIDRIDVAARWILAEIGIRIFSANHVRKLEAAGATYDGDTRCVRFEADVLDELIGKAPSRFTLYSRDGVNNLHLGSKEVYFGGGGRAVRLLDMRTAGYRPTLLRDVAATATLVENANNIRFYIVACQAHDVESDYYHLNDFYHSFRNTRKHVMGGCGTVAGARQVWELASLIAGGEDMLRKRPFYSIITNPISPLTLDDQTLDIFDFNLSRGIPCTCASAPISGATAPATLAGTLAVMHAEALAGVAVAQAFRPGARVLYGTFPMPMDLKTMSVVTGAVETGMMNAIAVQLSDLYGIPIYASGGLTEAKTPDIQAGFEKNFSNMTVAMAGADIIHLTAGLMDSAKSISYEQYLIDDENIGMINRIVRGVEVTDETLALDVIKKVNPGGNFLMDDHTLRHMDELIYPALIDRCEYEVWIDKQKPSMLSKAVTRVREILKAGGNGVLKPDLDTEIRERFPQIQDV